jgi:hypothetical protein
LVSLTNIKNRKMKHHVELYPALYTEASSREWRTVGTPTTDCELDLLLNFTQ